MSEPYSVPYYPVFLDLRGRSAVVVGGGSVAERKISTLLEYGADVTCIAPTITPRIDALVADGRVVHEERGYVRGDLGGAFIVVCATDSTEVNRAVYQEAEGRGCLVNVVDSPELCNFIVPSIVKRGPLQIAISTSGAAPAVAKQLRCELEQLYGPEWEDYVAFLGRMRRIVMERVVGGEAERKPIFEAIARSNLFERLACGEECDVEEVFVEFASGCDADSNTDASDEHACEG